MTARSVFIAVLALALCSGCAPEKLPAPLVPAQINPVIDADFPDPAVLRASDGFYYVYATQTEQNGKWLNIQVARSQDLVKWEHLGDALPAKPGWASKTGLLGATRTASRRALLPLLFRQAGCRPNG